MSRAATRPRAVRRSSKETRLLLYGDVGLEVVGHHQRAPPDSTEDRHRPAMLRSVVHRRDHDALLPALRFALDRLRNEFFILEPKGAACSPHRREGQGPIWKHFDFQGL